ncbi:MAG: hypothetical protein ACKKMS_02190 [Candidatus Nealsonbacteria bacterium]
MKQCLVLTTINIPYLLRDYAKNFVKYKHQKDVEILVIGDIKTPAKVNSLIDEVRSLGVSAHYINISTQKNWLSKFPTLDNIIPYNSDNRRNIGYLMAVERGAGIIVIIDDDNFVDPKQDFFKDHSIVGQVVEFDAVSSESGWFNVCSMLKVKPDRVIFPRGFPYSKRWKGGDIRQRRTRGRVVINEGLWFNDPDIDSITRLTEDVKVTGIIKDRLVLDQGTFAPINTQNTAFHRDILPCAYFLLMGKNIRGLKIDRYGDIWFGLFAKKIIDHLNDYVSFGKPFSIHRRNQHNLFKDLQQELWAIILTDTLVEFLESINLKSSTYNDCYHELADQLEKFASNNKNLDKEVQSYFKEISSAMRVWLSVCASL